jgi:hypothetical protein
MRDIEENFDNPWDWKSVSCNPNLTLEMVLKNLDKDWNFYGISKNEFLCDKKSIRYREYEKNILAQSLRDKIIYDVLNIILGYI